MAKVYTLVALAAVLVVGAIFAGSASADQPQVPTVKIVNLKSQSKAMLKKFQRCRSHGRKVEQPARPVDPQAKCSGKLLVHVRPKATAECPPGWFGGKASAVVDVRQRVRVSAFAQAIARGRAQAWARGWIRDRVKAWVKAEVTCVKETPPAPQVPSPTPTPTPPQPPSQPQPVPPSVGNVTQPQEVYVNETYPNIRADVSAPAGHSVRVVFSAKYGSFPDSAFTFNGGFARPSKTYHAPGDVTPTGTDTITVTVYDLTTGITRSASSSPFPVWPPKPVCC